MFEGGFRQVLRREADRISLPDESRWVPPQSVRTSATGSAAIVGIALVVLLGVVALREARIAESPVAQAPAKPTPPSRPTMVDGSLIAPLPNVYRNTQFNLVLPAWFHETPAPAGIPSDPALIDRRVFSARTDGRVAPVGEFLPWDLIVEVYRRDGRSLADWVVALGCRPAVPTGDGSCISEPRVIRGATAVVATRSVRNARSAAADTFVVDRKTYVVDRGDQVLVLRYYVGNESDRPTDVNEATLQTIVDSLGLP